MIFQKKPHTKVEKQLFKQEYQLIAGLDEVGRGAWAGPLVAAAVIMPKSPRLYNIRDSKELHPHKRSEFARRIQLHAIAYSFGVVTNQEIDLYGMTHANQLAFTRALEQLSRTPDYLLIDAFTLPHTTIKQQAIVRGDQEVYSIACASIIAKVYRDKLMEQIHYQLPQYGFAQNKGYGTKQHQAAIAQYGVTNLHRQSFRPIQERLA